MRRSGGGGRLGWEAAFTWAFVALVMAVFVELGFRAFDHEWDVQMRRNAQMREMRGE